MSYSLERVAYDSAEITQSKKSLNGTFSWRLFRLWFLQNLFPNMQHLSSSFWCSLFTTLENTELKKKRIFVHIQYQWHEAFGETGWLVHRSLGGASPLPPFRGLQTPPEPEPRTVEPRQIFFLGIGILISQVLPPAQIFDRQIHTDPQCKRHLFFSAKS